MLGKSLSHIFTRYNQMKPQMERGRLDRALGLAQSKQAPRPYVTTETYCTCPDWIYRIQKTGGRCKHQAALALRGK